MKIVVLGSGESAIGAALLAHKYAQTVFVSDSGLIKPETQTLLNEHSIRFEESGHSIDIIGKADLVIKSPGIPRSASIIVELINLGIEVIGEIEYGYRHLGESKSIGITGSNGKSTVSNMIYQCLKYVGLNVCIGGNFGKSLCRILSEDHHYDYFVLELSSFQLEDIVEFTPDISILLNITPDHLDRYEYDIEKYAAAKFRITIHQGDGHLIVYNKDDQRIAGHCMDLRVPRIGISMKDSTSQLAQHVSLDDLPFSGVHNHFNAMIAQEVVYHLGFQREDAYAALKNYQALPHRMEVVAKVDGVTYVNDSKATNTDAVFYALGGVDGSVVWIVGGTDKGNDYTALDDLVKSKVRHIVCMGLDNQPIIQHYSQSGIPLSDHDSLESAMEAASGIAVEGDTVLLSPACASFDLFDNYIHRGLQFKDAVFQLIYKK